MKSNTLKIVLVLFMTIKTFAQKQELGKVTIDELKEKVCPKDSSAVATYLFNKSKTYFEYSEDNGFVLKTEVEAKLKIYKKDGYEWANHEVQVYIGGAQKETVVFDKAVTYNLVNGAIEKTKIKNEGEFVEHVNKYWDKKKITMPNVKEGSIIEYAYTITSPYISNLQEWDFQKTIPVKYSEYKSYIPEYFIYSTYFKGSLKPIVENDSKNRTFKFHTAFSGNNSDRELTYTEFIKKFSISDIPALKEEEYVNNIDNYTASISNELISIQYPDSPFQNFATNWDDVSKKIYESDNFGAQLNKNNYYEDDLKTLIQGLTTVDEKVETIFNYVKSRMNWNRYIGIYCDNGVKKAYQDKIGNSADINLMLVSMLRYAGLDANPVLISTRSNGIAIYPTITAFNTVIAAVQNGQSLTLLDATSKNSYINILPINDLNWFGRIIKKDEASQFVELMPTELSLQTTNILVNLDDKGNFSGKARSQYSNYFAYKFRDKNGQLTNDNYLEQLEKKYNIEVSDYELTNEKVFTEPLVEKFSLKANNSVDRIGDKMYFSPLMYLATTINPFKQETREYPVDFNFPIRYKNMINITIPDGYKVESMPKAIAISMDKSYGSYKFSMSNNTPNILQISTVLEINSSIIPSDDYETLKEFFKMMVEKESEKVVLVKG